MWPNSASAVAIQPPIMVDRDNYNLLCKAMSDDRYEVDRMPWLQPYSQITLGGIMEERNREIDILKAIGIILMVFNHVGWGIYVHTYIQSFHMPLFFIVSGYLYIKRPLKDVILKRAKTLLLPYFLFMLIYLICALTTSLPVEKTTFGSAIKAILLYPTDNKNMPISPALWFLPCMFFTSVIYTALGRLNLVNKAVAIIAVVITGAVYSGVSDYMLPFCIEPTAAALFFLLIGELIREKKTTKYLSNSYFVVGLLIFEAVLAFMNKSVDLRSARFHVVPLYFLNGIMGTIAYWGIAGWILKTNSRIGGVIQKELMTLGKYSVVFLLTHQFFMLIMKKCFADILEKGAYYEAGTKAFIFIITMLLCRLIVKDCKDSNNIRGFFGLS